MRWPSISQHYSGTAMALCQITTVLFFLLLVLTNFARFPKFNQSQSRQNNQNDTQDAIKINVDLVVLHATVLNHKGISVLGLDKEAFQVYEDGILQEIESFSHEDVPVTVGLVIDNSGSMRPKRTEVITAGLAFARASNTKDQIFVVNFNEQVSFGLPTNTPFTDKSTQLEFALSNITADGMTALYDAVAAGLKHLKQGKWDKQVLVVISDGADNASRHNLEWILALAKQSDAIVYTIGIYDRDDPDRNPGSLKRLAKATGGEVFLPMSVKDIVPICERIAHDIRNQYTITYVSTNIKYDGKYRAIQVKARGGNNERMRGRTRAGYYATLKP